MHQVLMQPYRRWIAELEQMDATAAQIHPDGKPHLWTAAQLTEHLILSLREMRSDLEECLRRDRIPQKAHRTRVEWLLQLLVLGVGHLPVGVPAPRPWTPPAHLPFAHGRELARRLTAELAAADAVLDLCRQRFGMERVGRHFLLGPLRVDQWRRYHALHLRHHHTQLRQLALSVAVPPAHTPLLARA